MRDWWSHLEARLRGAQNWRYASGERRGPASVASPGHCVSRGRLGRHAQWSIPQGCRPINSGERSRARRPAQTRGTSLGRADLATCLGRAASARRPRWEWPVRCARIVTGTVRSALSGTQRIALRAGSAARSPRRRAEGARKRAEVQAAKDSLKVQRETGTRHSCALSCKHVRAKRASHLARIMRAMSFVFFCSAVCRVQYMLALKASRVGAEHCKMHEAFHDTQLTNADIHGVRRST